MRPPSKSRSIRKANDPLSRICAPLYRSKEPSNRGSSTRVTTPHAITARTLCHKEHKETNCSRKAFGLCRNLKFSNLRPKRILTKANDQTRKRCWRKETKKTCFGKGTEVLPQHDRPSSIRSPATVSFSKRTSPSSFASS